MNDSNDNKALQDLVTDLQAVIDGGKIEDTHIRLMVDEMLKQKALEQHENSIWQGTNGYWYTYINGDNGKRRLVKKKSQMDLIKVILNLEQVQERSPTFAVEFSKWIQDRADRGRIKQSTKLRYEQVHKKYFGMIDKLPMEKTKPYTFQHFLETIVSKYDMTSKQYCNTVTILRGTLKYAKRRGLIDFSVDEMFEDVDVSDKQFRKVVHEDCEEVFSVEEMQEMVDYLKENRDVRNDGLLLLFCTGIRVGELVSLRPENLGEQTVSIRATETRYKKDGKYVFEVADFPKTAAGVRDVVIPPEYQWLLKSLKENSKGQEFVFMEHGVRLNEAFFRKRLTLLCNLLGIYHKSPHKIRKTYASILLDNHVDESMVRSQMGHNTIAVTEEHYHRDRKSYDDKAKILQKIPDFM